MPILKNTIYEIDCRSLVSDHIQLKYDIKPIVKSNVIIDFEINPCSNTNQIQKQDLDALELYVKTRWKYYLGKLEIVDNTYFKFYISDCGGCCYIKVPIADFVRWTVLDYDTKFSDVAFETQCELFINEKCKYSGNMYLHFNERMNELIAFNKDGCIYKCYLPLDIGQEPFKTKIVTRHNIPLFIDYNDKVWFVDSYDTESKMFNISFQSHRQNILIQSILANQSGYLVLQDMLSINYVRMNCIQHYCIDSLYRNSKVAKKFLDMPFSERQPYEYFDYRSDYVFLELKVENE